MMLARLSLGLSGLAFAAFGVWFLVSPTALGRIGVLLQHPNAVTEIRAFYGGLELALGVFFLLALRRPAWYVPALMVQALSLGGVAATRLFGIALGGTTELMLALAAAEAAGSALAVVALLRLDRAPPSA